MVRNCKRVFKNFVSSESIDTRETPLSRKVTRARSSKRTGRKLRKCGNQQMVSKEESKTIKETRSRAPSPKVSNQWEKEFHTPSHCDFFNLIPREDDFGMRAVPSIFGDSVISKFLA